MEFLVQIKIDTSRISKSHQAELYKAEGERAKELTSRGYVVRLWRVPGRRENWGLWKAVDATDLHGALESLPLWPYQDVTVIPLALNVNDPGRGIEQGEPYDSLAVRGGEHAGAVYR